MKRLASLTTASRRTTPPKPTTNVPLARAATSVTPSPTSSDRDRISQQGQQRRGLCHLSASEGNRFQSPDSYPVRQGRHRPRAHSPMSIPSARSKCHDRRFQAATDDKHLAASFLQGRNRFPRALDLRFNIALAEPVEAPRDQDVGLQGAGHRYPRSASDRPWLPSSAAQFQPRGRRAWQARQCPQAPKACYRNQSRCTGTSRIAPRLPPSDSESTIRIHGICHVNCTDASRCGAGLPVNEFVNR